ncbi:MAG: SPOR domain-containing protein [Haliscomenobacter sp.]
MLRFILLLAFSYPLLAYAQDTATGMVQFSESPEVQQVLNSYVSSNRNTTYLKGWRIQILSTTDRERLEQVRTRFRTQYPDLSIVSQHNRPYYMLRVGAFTDKLDAIRLQQFLRSSYPTAYLIQDNEIEPQQLLGTTN